MKRAISATARTVGRTSIRLVFYVWTTFLYVALRLLPRLLRTSKSGMSVRIPLPVAPHQTFQSEASNIFPKGLGTLGISSTDIRIRSALRTASADVGVTYRRAPFGILREFQEKRIASLLRTAANLTWIQSLADRSGRPVPLPMTQHALRPARRTFRIDGAFAANEGVLDTNAIVRGVRRAVAVTLYTSDASQLVSPPLRPLTNDAGETELTLVVSLASSLTLRSTSSSWQARMKSRMHRGQFTAGPGAEPSMTLELFMPVETQTTHGAMRSFVLLFGTSLPMIRPQLPIDHYTGSYRVRSEGLRFCLGDKARQLLFHGVYRLVRPLSGGDALPAVLRADRFLTDFSDQLDVMMVRQEIECAVNRVYVVEGAPFPERLPGPADFFEDLFGLAFREGRACFIPEFTVRTLGSVKFDLSSFEFRVPSAVTESPGPPVFEEPVWPDPRRFSFVTDTGH